MVEASGARFPWWGPAVCLVALLAACGGGGGGGDGGGMAPVQPLPPDGPAALNAYFPTTAGSRWYYERTNLDGVRGQFAVAVSGESSIGGRTVTVMTANDAVEQTTSTAYFSTTADGVREHTGPGSDAAGTGLESYVLLRLPASTPAPYLQYDVAVANPPDVDGDGRPDALRMRSVVRTTASAAPVTTRAGRFDDCVQQHLEGTVSVVLSRTGATLVITLVGDDWYARDIGLVKSTLSSSGQGVNLKEELVLDAYVIANRRSEQVAPTVLVPTVPPQTVRGLGLDVVVKFSEPMYAPSLTGGAVALLDGQGQRVPGTVTVSGDEAHFRPDTAPASGSYQLTVDTRAVDLVGNALAAPVSWAVLVDSDGPGVLSTLPADGATGVRPDVRIEVRLSELPSGGLDIDQLRLLDPQGQRVAAQAEVVGTALYLQPQGRLQAGASYLLNLGPGLSDALGNVSGNGIQARFTVDPDGQGPRLLRMEPPDGSVDVSPDTPLRLFFDEPLAAPLGQQSITFAVDGSPFGADLVVSLEGSVVTLTPRSPMPQDAVVRIVVGPVADLLGNANTVPVNLAVSTVRSRFDPVTSLNLDAVVWATDLGDLDGDGRIDQMLVTGDAIGLSGLDTYQLQVRLGLPGGGRGEPLSLPLPGNQCAMNQVQIVDLDGDGRKDVLVSGRFCGLWVYPQQADGSLGAPQRVSGLDFQQVRAVDMDGDGRPELVGVNGSQLGTWFRDGAGVWSAGPSATLPAPLARQFTVGDVNGDGRPDVVVALDNGPLGAHVAVYVQAASGGLALSQTLWASQGVAWVVAVGDVDGDGRADVLATTGGNLPRAALAIWPQRPDGSLGAEQLLPVYEVPQALLLADVDGDGRLDVIVGHAGYFRIGVLLQTAGGLGAELLYPARATSGSMASEYAAGDLNGDGRIDIVVAEQSLIQRAPVSARTMGTLASPPVGARKAPQTRPVPAWQRLLPGAAGRTAR